MPDIDLNSRVWSDRGTKPVIGDETYSGGVQPIAQYDNFAEWSVTKDLHNLRDAIGDLDDLYINVEGDIMEGDLGLGDNCLTFQSGWEICNGDDSIHLGDGSDVQGKFVFKDDQSGNPVEEIDGYVSWHEGNLDIDDYYTKNESNDRFLNVDGSDHMEASLDVGEHGIERVDGSIEFSSSNGAGLDFRSNSDGNHHLFQHSDGEDNPTEYQGQLKSSSGQILELQEGNSYRHRFGTDGDYRNTGSIHSSGSIRTDDHLDVQKQSRGGDGFRISAADDRPFIAPTPGGESNYGDELYWQSGEWTVETPFNVEGDIQLHDNDVRGIESLFFTENNDVDAGIHYRGDRQSFNVEDTDKGDRPIQVESGPVNINRNLNVSTVDNLQTLNFNSPGGTAIDLTKNADGSHYFWEHADGNGNTAESHLGIGSGYIEQLSLNGNTKHEFQNDGNYENWGGADIRGDVNLHDNGLNGVERVDFTDGWATSSFEGTYRLIDREENGSVYTFNNEHIFDEGQVNFRGGSVYWGNTAGNNPNDSYDAVWTNQPSGKDFRIHMKNNPEDSALHKDYGMLFSTNGNHDGPIIACNVDNGITHVEELRSARNERSGTPVAKGELYNDLDEGEICYDESAGEFFGKTDTGVDKLS